MVLCAMCVRVATRKTLNNNNYRLTKQFWNTSMTIP